jgi:hypothetical protein
VQGQGDALLLLRGDLAEEREGGGDGRAAERIADALLAAL